jgi:hypothetical protein
MLNAEIGVGCGSTGAGCGGAGECPAPPDLCIKRHDTRPSLKVSMSDCEGPVDLADEGIAVEASMWFDAKLKGDLTSLATEIRFADDIGFDSVAVGDKILTSKSRSPESMLVTSVNESSKTVTVLRAQGGTTAQAWPKGSQLSVFRFMDEPAQIESILEDVEDLEGSVSEVLVDTLLVFDWTSSHTSVPGCYWVEFKVLKISGAPGSEVIEWIKRVPLASQGFMVRVIDSPTSPS